MVIQKQLKELDLDALPQGLSVSWDNQIGIHLTYWVFSPDDENLVQVLLPQELKDAIYEYTIKRRNL